MPHLGNMAGKAYCPKCGDELWRESCDVGVGVVYGPWGCSGCGYSESEEYDLSGDRNPVDEKGGALNQFGVYYPSGNTMATAYRMSRAAELDPERYRGRARRRGPGGVPLTKVCTR
jgi:predicted RNA-binding Zn-ribbon protein involved in translation (DUF1610 family)